MAEDGERNARPRVTMDSLGRRLTLLERRVNKMDERLCAVEDAHISIANILTLATKAKNLIKIWAPIIAVAAVSSGLIEGKFGAFLANLTSGIG